MTIVTKHDDHDDERKDNEYGSAFKRKVSLHVLILKKKRLLDRKGWWRYYTVGDAGCRWVIGCICCSWNSIHVCVMLSKEDVKTSEYLNR